MRFSMATTLGRVNSPTSSLTTTAALGNPAKSTAAWCLPIGRSGSATLTQRCTSAAPTTATKASARFIAAAGNVSALVASCAPRSGKRIQHPSTGDIGVIGSPTNIHRQFGAIHDGNGWLVRMHGGFGRMTARTLAAWKI